VTATARSERIFSFLPDYFREDPNAQAVVEGVSAELDRLESFLTAVQAGFFPDNADDTYSMLSLWESIVGLPVAPAGVGLAQRANRVTAYRRRKLASGADWEAAITEALGSTSWTYDEVSGGITINIPADVGGWSSGTILTLVRRITPAHLEINAAYGTGFILGESKLGEDTF
jgi:uncharacterized protein YmfQ (DUF2313 family)